MLVLFGQPGVQHAAQRRQNPGVGIFLAHKGGRRAVLRCQLGHLVVAGRGVEQIGRQLAVKDNGASLAPGVQRQVVERFGVKGPDLGAAVQQGGQLLRRGGKNLPLLHGVPAPGPPGKIKPPRGMLRQGRGVYGGQVGGGNCGRSAALVQPPAHRQLVHLQVRQQQRGGGRVPRRAPVGAGVPVHRRVPADGAQRVGKLRQLPVGGQLFPLFGLDGGVVQMVVYPRQAAEFLHQRQGGFLTDARHAGNVVRGIAHQALDLDELGRGDAVFFRNGGLVHDKCFPVGGQQHGGGAVHQLQAVPVTGGQQGGAARRLGGGGQRTQNVVRFPSGTAHLGKAQIGQQLFQNRHLAGQFLRHPVAGSLVTFIGLVAEGGSLLVPGDGHGVGLVGREQIEQNILEPKDGVGIPPILGGQQFDAKIGPVHQAVAVQYQQFHSFLLKGFGLISITQIARLWGVW